MWQDKENINTDQIQCFTPKKSLRDIFSSVSNGKISTISPSKHTPHKTPLRQILLRDIQRNDALQSAVRSAVGSHNPILLPKVEIPSISHTKHELEADDPLNSSLASYNFSYFQMESDYIPPPSPSPAPRATLDFAPIKFEPDVNSCSSDTESNASDANYNGYAYETNSALDTNSVFDAENEEADDLLAGYCIPAHIRPSIAHTLGISISDPFRPPPYSFSSFDSILNSPAFDTLVAKPHTPTLAGPTKMRVPNPKTSVWAFPPGQYPPTLERKDSNASLSKFDQLFENEELEDLGIPRSTSMMFGPSSSSFGNTNPTHFSSFDTFSFSQAKQPPTNHSSLSTSTFSSTTPAVHRPSLFSSADRKLSSLEAAFVRASSTPVPTQLHVSESTEKESKIPSLRPPALKPLQSFTPTESHIPTSSQLPKKEPANEIFQSKNQELLKFVSDSTKPKVERSLQPPESKTRIPRTSNQESSNHFTLPSAIPKPSLLKRPENGAASAIPKKGTSNLSKQKSTIDLDTSFHTSTNKPRPTVDLLNTSLQLPSKKPTPIKAKPALSGIRRPSTLSSTTPKKTDNILDSSFSSMRSSSTKPSPALPRPSLSSATPNKKRNISELDSSFSSFAPTLPSSSITPKRKPRPSEIIHGVDLSSTPSFTPNKSSHFTPKVDTASNNRVKTGTGKKSSSTVPPLSFSLESSRVPSVKKLKLEEKPKSTINNAEFEQKLELALQSGSIGGNTCLPRTPEGQKGESTDANKWSPIRKRALAFEDSVLACTKKVKNDM